MDKNIDFGKCAQRSSALQSKGGGQMKRKWKEILGLTLVTACALGCIVCNNTKGELPENAAARVQSESDGAMVYIDDGAIALAGEVPQTANLGQAAQEAVTLTNQQRAAAGLPALAWNQGLADAAFVRAQEIVGTFSHTRPNGSDWWTVNSQLMYGENLAKGYSSADAAVQGWMASPTHKANILDGGFKTVGIAVFRGSDGKWYWAQEFGY